MAGAGDASALLAHITSGAHIVRHSGGNCVEIEPLQFIGISYVSGRAKADLPRFHHAAPSRVRK